MHVLLDADSEKVLADLLGCGHYRSANEVLAEGLRLVKKNLDARESAVAAIRKEIALGTAQAREGRLRDGDEVFKEIRLRSLAAQGKSSQ
ncbi:MAG: hypothetical protein OHK0021_24300 [Bryobacter sp.]